MHTIQKRKSFLGKLIVPAMASAVLAYFVLHAKTGQYGSEAKVAFARQAYNDAVMNYNTDRESFPANIISGMFHFAEAQLFEIQQPEHREAPKVSFGG